MSRAIPKVRVWRVALYDASNKLANVTYVYAPNKRFARWNARDVLGHMAFYNAARVTVGLMRDDTPKSLIHTP